MLDRKILLSAQEGDKKSMLSLARSYFDEGAYQDAFYWTYLAAKAGFAPAYFPLGRLYGSGKGIAIDAKKCNYWLKKAIKSGSVKALVYLADNYYDGFGVHADYEKAVRYYKKAAELGDSYAEYRLGVCLCFGVGVRENKEKARYYFLVSSSFFSFPSFLYLFHCYIYNSITYHVQIIINSDKDNRNIIAQIV